MHTKTLLLIATALTLSAGAAFASEGQYVSPYNGEPTELMPAFPDVTSLPATAPTANADTAPVYTSMSGNHTTDPAVTRQIFPGQINEN